MPSQTLIDLQAEYQGWLDNLPDSLQGSAVAEKLEAICGYGLRRPGGPGAAQRIRERLKEPAPESVEWRTR